MIFQAGSSDAGIKLAGKYADAVFTHSPSIAETKAFRDQVRGERPSRTDAGPMTSRSSPVSAPSWPATVEEAQAKYEQSIRNLLSDRRSVGLSRPLLRSSRLLASISSMTPFPELGDIGKNSFRSTTDRIEVNAQEQGQTLREVALEAATPSRNFIGTGAHVADEIIRWIDAGAADGFILGFSVTSARA